MLPTCHRQINHLEVLFQNVIVLAPFSSNSTNSTEGTHKGVTPGPALKLLAMSDGPGQGTSAKIEYQSYIIKR